MARGVCSTAGLTCCGDDTGRAGQSQRGLHGQRRTGVARRPSMAQRASALGLGVVFRMEDLVGGVLHRLSHITAGQVAGQQGEEAAQPVLGVWEPDGIQSCRMRGSGPAYLGFFGLPWFLVPDKSPLREVLAGVL